MGVRWLRRAGVEALAAWVAVVVAGCGDDAVGGRPDDGGVEEDGGGQVPDADAGLPFGGEPTIRVGTGCFEFFDWRPIEPGASLPIEPGGQGAQHFWVGIRGWNLDLDPGTNPDPDAQRTTGERTFYRILDQSDGSVVVEEDLGDRLRLWPTPELGPAPHRTNLGFVVIDNEIKEEVLGMTLVFEVERAHRGQRLVHRVEGITGFDGEPCEPPDPP